jgi:hypothetical protein
LLSGLDIHPCRRISLGLRLNGEEVVMDMEWIWVQNGMVLSSDKVLLVFLNCSRGTHIPSVLSCWISWWMAVVLLLFLMPMESFEELWKGSGTTCE